MTNAKFGWKAGAEQFSPKELLVCAKAAEVAGFDSIAISDHFHPWAETGEACFAWSWLGAAAVQTENVALGTGLTCPILRYHPAIVAQAAATVASLAPGRVYLAVGTGEALNEYPVTGLWPSYSIRQEMLAEAIELIRQLWMGEAVTFEGKYYQTHKARLYTLPEENIPIYIATKVPGSATFAGKHGDGLLTVGGQEPEVYKEIMKNFEEGAIEAGKDPKKLPRQVEINVAYTDDAAGAVAAHRKYWAGTYVPALFNRKIYTPKESEENGKPVGDETIKKSMCISSKPEDHVAFIQKYLDYGFDEIFLHSSAPDQQAFVEGYGNDVLPQLREKKAQNQKA